MAGTRQNVQGGRADREIDPYHPYWVNEAPRDSSGQNHTRQRQTSMDSTSIPYRRRRTLYLEDKGLTAVGKIPTSAERRHFSKPIWMILQSFAWEQCGKPDVPPEKATYPTWEQSRFMMYNAIVHGATGMQYHYLGYANKISDQFWSDLRKVTLEISYLEDVITSDSVNPKTVAFDNRTSPSSKRKPTARCTTWSPTKPQNPLRPRYQV